MLFTDDLCSKSMKIKTWICLYQSSDGRKYRRIAIKFSFFFLKHINHFTEIADYNIVSFRYTT